MQYRFHSFKLTPYYSPKKTIIRCLFARPTPKHWAFEDFAWGRTSLSFSSYTDCYSIYGDVLSSCGYNIPRIYKNQLFLRFKMELPNDPNDLIGGYGFNNKRVVELSKKNYLEPPLITGAKDCPIFQDKLISAAAALYRGDMTVDVFAPYFIKEAHNYANQLVSSNFT